MVFVNITSILIFEECKESAMNENTTIITFFLTSAVVGSLVTSVANIIITIFNNHRLKSIEKEKQKNDLITYRYKCLYNMLLKWHEYDTPFDKDKDPLQIAKDRVCNGFFDNHRRFQIISPLMDEKYKETVNKLNKEGEKLLSELFKVEFELDKNFDAELSQKHEKLFKEFIDISTNYAIEIEIVKHMQLEVLLNEINA